MGYSARYHAASLAGVFLALAVGILIGVGFGDDVISGTAENLEASLKRDLEGSRQRTDELQADLGLERDFAEGIYPAVVAGRLRNERVAVLALGGLSDELSADIEAALRPTGADLRAVAVVRLPPDVDAIADELGGHRGRRLRRDPQRLTPLGRRVGRALVKGGPEFERVGETMVTRFSGDPGRIRDVIIVRERTPPEGARAQEATAALEDGLVDGVMDAPGSVVGVERSDAEPSAVPFFDAHGMSTVDDVDRVAGRVAMVYALRGAKGNFGIREGADRQLPDLLPGQR